MSSTRSTCVAFLAVVALVLSCERAERVALAPEASSPTPLLGNEGGADPPDSFSVSVVPDSLFFSDSLAVADVQLIESARPEALLDELVNVYNERDAAGFSQLLAEDYVCTEITPCGMRQWGRQEEILIHERMFDLSWPTHPVAEIRLTLSNLSASPVDAPPLEPEVWELTCDADLVLEYANPDQGVFQYLGPARFLVRRNPDFPCEWELVEWHDCLPGGW